ncbi:uncharacterized protein METZ01_LOCUS119598 [marine metagenome]|jgi:YggT family protein|uniref:YggT family protein n=1 Tax=marine metagenome TaxID=408172 RepID=A0A381XPP1_9ZZZZ
MNHLLFSIINNGFNLFQMLILIRVVMSWIPHDSYGQLPQLLHQITDPVLKPIREILPVQSMGFDFSPVIAFFALGFVKKLLLSVV